MTELPPTLLYEVCENCGALVETSSETACSDCGTPVAKRDEAQRSTTRAGLLGGLVARVADRLPL